jgi:drug/metabolite transporter (DMT)-like permease
MVGTAAGRERAGLAASLLFVGLASVRDVYLAGLFQRVEPLALAALAFGLCSALFLPGALLRHRASLRELARRPGVLLGVNLTTALAWVSFLLSLRLAEPLLVQVLFAGVGPLSVIWLDRLLPGGRGSARPDGAERASHAAIGLALAGAVLVSAGGRSGTGPQPWATAAAGVLLPAGAGVAISASTILCRRLHDAGITPGALLAVRFPGAAALAAALALGSGAWAARPVPAGEATTVLAAAVGLIVLPVYLSQVGVSLASPLTVRAALAVAPAVIFGLQWLDGRLPPSPWSLAVALLYAAAAGASVVARGRALARAAAPPAPAPGALTGRCPSRTG